ncbi:MAG: ribonuclease III [Lachnospiraceae bacterium]|nr:ribonuclease III [Lachnospiraceae bacterium]
MNERENLQRLQQRIGYAFKDQTLLRTALTHSSYAHERKINKIECNERLEFLGDAVLEQISSDHIFRQFPKMPEGEMSKLRAALVCETALAECAKQIGLGELLFLGRGEEGSGGRSKPSVTSDAFEALIGAIYLDGGIGAARDFVEARVLYDVKARAAARDTKTALQEYLQAGHVCEITYEVVDEQGPEHAKEFTVQVCIDKEPYGLGKGRNKKSAEKAAAAAALERLKKTKKA